MALIGNADTGYASPPSPNERLDAEETDRVVLGVRVKRQAVIDRVVEQRLLELMDVLDASDVSATQTRDALVAAINSATDEEVRDVVANFRTAFAARDLATSARQDQMLAELRLKPNAGEAVHLRPTLEQRQLAGYAFTASSGRVQLAAAGNFRAVITVPSTSRWVHLVRLEAFCSAGPAFGRLLVNPAGSLPAAPARPVTNSRLGTPIMSSVEMRADASAAALTGGIDTGIDIAVAAGVRTVVDLSPLSIPPAAAVGLNIPFVGPSDVVLTAYWYEES